MTFNLLKKNKNKKTGQINEEKRDGFFYNRLNFFALIVFFVFVIISARLFSLQVKSYDYYNGLAENQHSIFKTIIPKRGEIYIKEKEDLFPGAVNEETKTALAVPREIKNKEEAAENLSKILSLDRAQIADKIKDPEDTHEIIKKRLSEKEVEEIKNLKMSGLRLIDEPYRLYPSKELASQVIGFVGWKDDGFGGRYGIENYFEQELSGIPGKIFQNKDNRGFWVATGEKEIEKAKNGVNLVLTIDHIIQYEAQKILANAVDKFKAQRGSVVIMETETGRILAMANVPSFDPNNYQEADMASFRNIAVSDSYECGSVFKPFTIAAALDSEKITPETTYIDTGKVVEGGYFVQNSDLKSHGKQTMTQVLEKSLNTGVVFAEKQIGNKNFSDYVKRFGFGEITGIDLPGEAKGSIANLENLKRNINFLTASFGQGITVTPIQLVSAYNALANGGMLMKPQIVEKIIYSDKTEKEILPEKKRKVISEKAAGDLAKMLRSVVVSGHGKQADVPGYLVGGKTGTAQVASREMKGYEEGKNIGSFVGFAPLERPAFTMLVRVDHPQEVIWAESSAAPVFGEIAKFILEYKNIKPTEDFKRENLELFEKNHTLRNHVIKNKENQEIKKTDE